MDHGEARPTGDPTDPAAVASAPEEWPSRTLVGRMSASLFVVSGALFLSAAYIPHPYPANSDVVLVAGLISLALGAASWFLPWRKWPREAAHILVPVGFALIAALTVYGGQGPYLFSFFYCVVFAAVGLAHPPWTSTKMLPLMWIAFTVSMLMLDQDPTAAIIATLIVGTGAVMIGEVVARITAMLAHSRLELHRAHEAVKDICALLGESEHDSTRLWHTSASWLCDLLHVPSCSVYRVTGEDELTCLASVIDGQARPESAGTCAELASRTAARDALSSRQPILIGSPDDPRLGEPERAAMLAGEQHAVLIVPLVVDDAGIGLVEIAQPFADRVPPQRR